MAARTVGTIVGAAAVVAAVALVVRAAKRRGTVVTTVELLPWDERTAAALEERARQLNLEGAGNPSQLIYVLSTH